MKHTKLNEMHETANQKPLSPPLIIAGPCSAESPEQLLQVALELKKTGKVKFMRAGVWKPRTTPNNFEGYGTKALEWLKEVKKQTKIPFATEVATEKHVYEALKFGADLLWIGARTASNPFAIQEIAIALKGIQVPVWVKNPLSPDLKLWEGAITRLKQAGVAQVGAIHRGFTAWYPSPFRNLPLWDIALKLKANHPELSIISDPSHISGDSRFVELLAKRAINMGFDGLMIEVHPNPKQALSDAKQQLTTEQFTHIISKELHRSKPGEELLDELRAEIDAVDELLIWALSNRMKLVTEIAQVKYDSGLEALQKKRWNEVLKQVSKKARSMGLSNNFIVKLFNSIHRESLLKQKRTIESKSDMVKNG